MCKYGDTIDMLVTVPAHLSHTGRERQAVKAIDRCIAPIVKALNTAGIATAGSCCGHGEGSGSVLLADGREVTISDRGHRASAS